MTHHSASRPQHSTEKNSYIGRFAPSPTGPLHIGSLLAAVASYLDARHHNGQWLLRIEDLDPPREVPGAADQIIRTLEHYGFEWDGEIIYQSQRLDAYHDALNTLKAAGYAYACDCSRQQIQLRGAQHYDDHCRSRQAEVAKEHAIRVVTDDQTIAFTDRIQGPITSRLHQDSGDFVIRRKDGLFAYQLAVVVDDAFQGITHTVRGSDLLDSTPKQLYLQQLLGFPTLSYGHIPVIVNAEGQKLSKQTYAPALPNSQPNRLLITALSYLGISVAADQQRAPPAAILAWAAQQWSISQIQSSLTVGTEPQ